MLAETSRILVFAFCIYLAFVERAYAGAGNPTHLDFGHQIGVRPGWKVTRPASPGPLFEDYT
jgi:hypothetical protein